MREIPFFFSDEANKKSFVLECENVFEERLNKTVDEIVGSNRSKVITLSGPTCSGKTTTANKLISEFTARGKNVHVVSIDDFYYDRALLLKEAERNGGELDFDSPKSIDFSAFSKAVEDIFNGGDAVVPIFDFKSGTRTGERTFHVKEDDMFIFEGIQAIYPEVTEYLEGHEYTSVFIAVLDDINIGGALFLRDDIRFLRRLVRDFNFRSAKPEFTFKLWESVRKNEDENIYPYYKKCDYIINSLLGYDIFMLRPYILSILQSVCNKSEYYSKAQEIINKLANIPEIDKDYMPSNSMFHEFLG